MRTPTQKRKTQNEMQLARGRLRGALNETLHDSDEEDDNENENDNEDYSDDEVSAKFQEKLTPHGPPQRGRPPKVRRDSGSLLQSPRSSRLSSMSPTKKLTPARRRKMEEQLALQQLQRIQAESFVMKLFDRSLDLSKYTECTELYPICRAWMANQPRNPSIQCCRNRRSPSPVERLCNGAELLAKLKRCELREVSAMPAPEKTALLKHPPMNLDDNSVSEEIPNLNNANKETLLASHMGKWKSVKTNWVKHTKRYQQRYEINHMIIQELFKP